MARITWLRLIFSAVALALAVVAFLAFAPTQLGGQTSYIIVNGNSMEPVYERGDLVLVRNSDQYQVGDIIAYQHPDIGPVIHRIIDVRDGLYLMQGDNNDWRDSYLPAQSEVLGEEWIHVPGVGSFLGRLRAPLPMAALAVVLGVLAVVSFTGSDDQQRRPGRVAGLLPALSGNKQNALTLLMALGFAACVLAVFAFTRGAENEVEQQIPYQHNGQFNYRAEAPAGIYDGEEVTTGQPVFRQVTDEVAFTYDYSLSSDVLPSGVEGVYTLEAVVSDSNGWSRTIPLQGETAFSGGSFTTEALLDLDTVQEYISELGARTAVPTRAFNLDIVASADVAGTLDGLPFSDQIIQRIAFNFDEIQMQVDSPGPEDTDPTADMTPGSVARIDVEPNTIPVFGRNIEVGTARMVAAGGIVIAVAGALALILSASGNAAQRGSKQIATQFGARMVTVEDGGLERFKRIVNVATIDDLARMAEQQDTMIFHAELPDGGHAYFVRVGDINYRYQLEDLGEDRELDADAPAFVWQRIRGMVSR